MNYKWGMLVFLCPIIITGCTYYFLAEDEIAVDNSILPPSFIEEIYPFPGSSLTIQEFRDRSNAPFVTLEESSVCVEVWGSTLLESGDELILNEILDRFVVEVNGYGEESLRTFVADSWEHPVIDMETEEVEFVVPAGFPAILCYPIDDPKVGEYIVTIVYEKTSGEKIQYIWSFYLKE